MPFFSVIIPAYNRLPYLLEALDSVWRQSFTDYEVIVVDDGSTDGTQNAVLEMLKSGNAEKLKLKYLRQENAGPGAARNRGAAHATGEYLAFLDSDDVWLPWTLQVYRDAIVFGETATFVSGRGQPKGVLVASEKSPSFQRFSCMFEACTRSILPVGGTPSVAIKRTSFEKAGGFASSRINGEDMDLWLRLGAEHGFVQIEEPIVFQQSYHDANVSNDIRSAADGVTYLFRQEQKGAYPGGANYKRQRMNVLTAFARTTSLQCLDAGQIRMAWELFRIAFSEQLREKRLKYIFGFFPVLIAKSFTASR